MDSSTIPGNATIRETSCHSESELDEFLDSIGWGSTYRRGVVAEERETPSKPVIEEPRSSPPKTRVAPRAEPRAAKGAAARYAFATVLVLGVIFRYPIESAVENAWSHFAGRSQEESLARALLTGAYFTSLLPGTSAEEVRERVGLPLNRGSGAAFKAEEAWYYSVPPENSGDPVRVFLVAMTRNKVVRALEITELRSRGRTANATPSAPRYLGDLKVAHRGKRANLSYSTDRATVLVGTSLDIPELAEAGFRILEPERAAMAKSGASVDIPPLAVYWRGVLYPLPLSTPDIPPSVLADDLKWLFRTLGCDETGKQLISDQPVLPRRAAN